LNNKVIEWGGGGSLKGEGKYQERYWIAIKKKTQCPNKKAAYEESGLYVKVGGLT